ncbi:hypothetical protein DEU56DRAFT_825126 [Suillus clintonianus]|uniref:uncharacterized protein n=1 Tax=Suillus clintonianus TaxID=1904413 RepID=UPI001B865CD6|nr:uncharacterized protein DEU56DRAFT_825126 [Suillus clintonianus]KAG2125447.1 hypothetical protein DEU56DRAFT_825126 [Suillus clintonianus]
MLIQVVAHSSQAYVSVLILLRARAMLIQVVAHSSQYLVSVIILCRPPAWLTDAILDPMSGCESLHSLLTLSPADQVRLVIR